MKRTSSKKNHHYSDLLPEYRFDYSKMKPNRFAQRLTGQKIVVLDPDVAKVFPNEKIVNETLRALVNIIPKNSVQRKKSA
ncbi:MAG: hypothetical protein KGJ59_09710 [Bacteroidota bacterium]|nr:hypothetical protein [Bacteroidota bacterium]